MAKKESVKKNTTNQEVYVDGEPCKHEDCANSARRLSCRYCGRTQKRGTTIIEDRTGNVYLERLRSIDIKLHNELSVEKQKISTLYIYRPPKYLDK